MKDNKQQVDTSKFKCGLFVAREMPNENGTEAQDGRMAIQYYCNCGNNTDGTIIHFRGDSSHTCSECGNSYFLRYSGNLVKMGAFMLEELSTTRIKGTRHNISAKIVDNQFVVSRVNMNRTILIDVFKPEIKIWKNGEFEYDAFEDGFDDNNENLKKNTTLKKKTTTLNTFFNSNTYGSMIYNGSSKDVVIIQLLTKSSNLNDFPIDVVKKSRTFFEKLIRIKMFYSGYNSYKFADLFNLFGLIRHINKAKNNNIKTSIMLMEKMTNADLDFSSRDFYQQRYDYYNHSYKLEAYNLDGLKLEKRRLNQIFGVPKQILSAIRESGTTITSETLGMFKTIRNSPTEKVSSLIMESVNQGRSDVVFKNITPLARLIERYNYDPKSLIDYIFNFCPMYQGITNYRESLVLLEDYISMSVDLGYRFDKYPKSLKLSHDIRSVEYKTLSNEIEARKFQKAVREYGDLIFQTSEYQILVPRSVEDLTDEGAQQSHCVASYVSRVVNGDSLIFFLRERKNLSKSLVTIELNKYHKLVQARGKFNRAIHEVERQVIYEWLDFVQYALTHRRQEEIKIESFS